MPRPVNRLAASKDATLAELLRALFELARARILVSRECAKALHSCLPGKTPLSALQVEVIERVSYVLPRVAARLPWRADCLVQALAAKHWLAQMRIPSRVHFGLHPDQGREFEAHAWLTVGEIIVTGGDVQAYRAFLPTRS